MKTRNRFSASRKALVIAFIALSVVVGAVVAQNPVPPTEPGAMGPASGSVSTDSRADGGVPPRSQDNPLAAASDTGVPLPAQNQTEPGAAADENPVDGQGNSPQGPQATFSYYYVSGATLLTRDSATGRDYSGTGCSYTVGGTDRIMNTELDLPDGAVIKYLRLYYNDTSAADDVRGYITSYEAGNSTNDLTSVSSTGSAGIGTSLSPEITHTVSNSSFAYVLIGWPDISASTVQVCGLRVAYYAPGTALFLPHVERNATTP
jgi:hypothetical protein